jgi:two-component system, sensor histidine kinase and response regulator
MELGADDYLTKPFKISELLAAIGTRLKKHEEIAAASQEKMQALRENLITSLPHELRTPLNTIIGFSDMLMVDADTLQPKLVAEWSQLIHAAGMRLYRLIENYLVYARIETLFRDPKQVATMRNNRVQHPAESLEYQVTVKAQQAGRASDLTLDLEDTASVIASEEDLKKILDEIVDNAFKFSEAGKAVIVKARVVDNFYQIDVTDHGRGFTPEQIAAVGAYMQFERWIYEQQGLGLGLTIARRFAELYGGTMKIESVHGEKTTATIRLLCG